MIIPSEESSNTFCMFFTRVVSPMFPFIPLYMALEIAAIIATTLRIIVDKDTSPDVYFVGVDIVAHTH